MWLTGSYQRVFLESLDLFDESVFCVVKTTLDTDSERKRQKSQINTLSDYPFVLKSESPNTRYIGITKNNSYIAGFRTFGLSDIRTEG